MDTVHSSPRPEALPDLVSRAFASGPPPLRARLLETLLQPLRPLSLAVVAAGAFGHYLHREAWGRVQVSVEDALAYSADQVGDLAGFVLQVAPEALSRAAQLVAEHPGGLALLGGALWLAARQAAPALQTASRRQPSGSTTKAAK